MAGLSTGRNAARRASTGVVADIPDQHVCIRYSMALRRHVHYHSVTPYLRVRCGPSTTYQNVESLIRAQTVLGK